MPIALRASRVVVVVMAGFLLFGQLFVGTFHPLVTAGVACGILAALATSGKLATSSGYVLLALVAVAGIVLVGLEAFNRRYGVNLLFASVYMLSLVPIAIVLLSRAKGPRRLPPNKSLERTREG